MNNIEILEKLKNEQYTKETLITICEFYDEEFKPYVLTTQERDALENLIQQYKELKEEKVLNEKIKEKIEDYDKIIKATYNDPSSYADNRRLVCFEIRKVLLELLEGN